jgi:non-canonical (house-cleaning) NTP pyrophosphatase
MEKIIIAVGSKRGPKLGAVTAALDDFGPLLREDGEFEVVGAEVESGVGHTPASSGELMRGARQRAEALVRLANERREPWNFFVGLEGGLEVLEEEGDTAKKKKNDKDLPAGRRRVFLESWAYVTDGQQGYYGRSGAIELPEALAQEVLENGIELSVAIDKFAGAVGIRDVQGAWGVLSANLISRQEAFRVAVIAAFAPFYNAKMFSAKMTKHAK